MDVLVARIGKPHGIKGEVTVQLFTDAPEDRFDAGETFRVEGAKVPELTVAKARWNKDILIVAFEQVADRNAAETLRGAQLFIDTTGTEDDDDDSWYEHELVGLEARVDGAPVGRVTALRTMAVQDLLVVELTGGHEAFVPFVGSIVPEVNPDEGFVVIVPPAGLFDLNTPGSNQAPDDGDDAAPDLPGEAAPGDAPDTARVTAEGQARD
ncbi:ribosome maturation factor RimM [Arthrobacter agilis]|uniref:ribosome maturation factor RimM n=1 Tax=Arthrobacter agilis TaxID=37921 RepID=UPI000B34E573|nr:ribosome maturation factor RimM [Arthrobacter agilis]OUM44814.1 ribosome maturation factor RimM [Arthrobacter agilis]PPB47138.1 ribosome maturation factor RimM [Arthrobacter agilis]TPV22552.1 ribosome maturation factor RimM [Arthrobacter agilis]VDR32377.1 Ribosome maturation factor rimM [Arthrobacter agilis]